jgi:hypothetical protein
MAVLIEAKVLEEIPMGLRSIKTCVSLLARSLITLKAPQTRNSLFPSLFLYLSSISNRQSTINMPYTRSMAKNESQIKPLGPSTRSQQPSLKPHARPEPPVPHTSASEQSALGSTSAASQEVQDEDFIDNIFAELRLKVDSELAKINLLRLFYLKETRPLMTPELYDDIEDPRFRTNVKLAVCFLLSDNSQLPKLSDTISQLLLQLRIILATRNGPVNLFSAAVLQPVHRQLLDLQCRFIDVVSSRLPPEDIFQQLAETFIEGYSSSAAPPCPLTRQQAGRHLVTSYGAKYKDYDWSVHSLRLMRLCLSLAYDKPHA